MPAPLLILHALALSQTPRQVPLSISCGARVRDDIRIWFGNETVEFLVTNNLDNPPRQNSN